MGPQENRSPARRGGRGALRPLLLAGAAFPLIALSPGAAYAQAETEVEEVVVTGYRATLQTSIGRKREETVVADVLSADDIGDLPALSIGEAIETITGASTHREKGAASEIAIRGLGPFLGAASFNGREATNGSGDRSVNFNAFPSELINTVAVYKTQRADFIEGGVSGIINLETVRPLDYKKRRIQLEARSIWADYDDKHRDKAGAGWRGTASYIDQFDFGEFGRLGVSFGLQSLEGTNPEELFTSSSTWNACSGTQTVAVTANCSPLTAAQVQAGAPFYLIPGSRTYRQFEERDRRDAVFAAVQFQPVDALEIAFDFQNSRRVYTEERHDLNFSETMRGVANREVSPNGTLLYYTGNTTIESTPTFRIRDEEYTGAGLRVTFNPTERLELSADLSYSHTYRSEMDRQVRLRSNATDINGAPIAGVINGQRVAYTFDYRNGDIPSIVVDPRYDLNRWENFAAAARVRRDESVRDDQIRAIRFDGDYTLDGWISSLKAGVRLSEREYDDFDDRVEINNTNAAAIRAANQACRREFGQTDFLSNASGNTISSWAQFDALCLFRAFTGVDDTGTNPDLRNIANRDVTERVTAAYVLGEFETEFLSLPVTGNLGVRFVRTEVDSVGLRGALDVINNPDGSIRLVQTGAFTSETVSAEFNQWLPSFNANFALRDDVAFRVGLFRAMSRPDPSSLGAGRSFNLESGQQFTSVEDAISGVTATGNPATEPLLSWNADLSLEWYPNRDTIFSVAVYAKQFNGGFRPVVQTETFDIDGVALDIPVVVDQTTDETSNLVGYELTAAQTFTFLPRPLDGLGVKLSYNYADSDYETQDIRLGEIHDPVTGTTTRAVVPPAGIFGLSNHVFSGQLFYSLGPIELQGIYKYRSEYYQKFVGAPSQLRYIRDSGVWDFRATYRLNDMISFSFEGSNLNDEPRYHDMPVSGSLREYNSYGPRYYLGMRVRL